VPSPRPRHRWNVLAVGIAAQGGVLGVAPRPAGARHRPGRPCARA